MGTRNQNLSWGIKKPRESVLNGKRSRPRIRPAQLGAGLHPSPPTKHWPPLGLRCSCVCKTVAQSSPGRACPVPLTSAQGTEGHPHEVLPLSSRSCKGAGPRATAKARRRQWEDAECSPVQQSRATQTWPLGSFSVYYEVWTS